MSSASCEAVPYRRVRSFSSAFIVIQSRSPRSCDGRNALAEAAQTRARRERILAAEDPLHLERGSPAQGLALERQRAHEQLVQCLLGRGIQI